MMPAKPPLFLKRQVYRRKRLEDAARVLPSFGAFLFLLPILWAPDETAKAGMASGGVFLFLAWTVLILITFFLSRKLTSSSKENPEESQR